MNTTNAGKRRLPRRIERGRRSRLLTVALVALLTLAGAGLTLTPTLTMAQSTSARITGDDGVILRAKPSFGGKVLDTLAEGTEVELRTSEADTVLDPDGATRWWPVRVYGQEGWVAGYFLDTADGAVTANPTQAAKPTTPAGEPAATTAATRPAAQPTGPTGATARVDDPDGVNMRAEPNAGAEILAPLATGTIVELRLDQTDTVVKGNVRWWPVRVYGQDGWIAGAYLSDESGNGEAGEPDPANSEDATNSEPTSAPRREAVTFQAGQYVSADASDGLVIRAEAVPGAEPVGELGDGEIVQVMEGPASFERSTNGWYLVTTGDVTGYVDGDLLASANQPAPPASNAEPTAAPRQPAAFGTGDSVAPADRDGVNIRGDASTDAGVVDTLGPDDTIDVVGEASFDRDGNAWYPVVSGDVTGYAAGEFLVAASARPAPTAAAAPELPAPPARGTATGTFIMPVSGYTFTQPYGCSPYAFEPWNGSLGCNFHNGIDLAAPAYTPIVASDGGTVKYAGWCDCGLGYYVEIEHGNGFATVYGHMAEIPYVATGQTVEQGEVIGPMGSTGQSTGSHTHFMLKLNGSTVDPLGYAG